MVFDVFTNKKHVFGAEERQKIFWGRGFSTIFPGGKIFLGAEVHLKYFGGSPLVKKTFLGQRILGQRFTLNILGAEVSVLYSRGKNFFGGRGSP